MAKKNNTPFDQLPQDLRYYLLDWKDQHPKQFRKKYGDTPIRRLTLQQLIELCCSFTKVNEAHVNRILNPRRD